MTKNCIFITFCFVIFLFYFMNGATVLAKTKDLGQEFPDVCQDSLVMSSVQIKEAPPSLRSAIQHSENAYKCGELTGCRWAPLLHHQMRDVRGLASHLGRVFCPPVSGGEECATAFKRGAVESHGNDHE